MSDPVPSSSKIIERLCALFIDAIAGGEILTIYCPKHDATELIGKLDLTTTGLFQAQTTRRSLTNIGTSRGYTHIFAIAGLVAELIASEKTTSQRDVYYALKPLFRNQAECNSAILELGLLLGLRRHEMHIIPAAKGFVAGHLSYQFMDNEIEDSEPDWCHVLPPSPSGGISVHSKWVYWDDALLMMHIPPNIKYLLVIEKQGIYHRLCEDRIFDKIPCILITGCGFPDLATRSLVHKITQRHPEIIALGLCDYNPYGISLLMSYRFASKSMLFEGNNRLSHVRWLGLRHSHLADFREPNVGAIEQSSIEEANESNNQDEDINPYGEYCTGPSFAILLSALNQQHWQRGSHFLYKIALKQRLFDTWSGGRYQFYSYNCAYVLVFAFLQTLPRQYDEELTLMDNGKINITNIPTKCTNLPVEYVTGGMKCELELLYSKGIPFISEFISTAIANGDYI